MFVTLSGVIETGSAPQFEGESRRLKSIVTNHVMIRVDQGQEFVFNEMDLWACQKGVVLDFSRPGNPTDKASIKAFGGLVPVECLNTHRFMSMPDVHEKLD